MNTTNTLLLIIAVVLAAKFFPNLFSTVGTIAVLGLLVYGLGKGVIWLTGAAERRRKEEFKQIVDAVIQKHGGLSGGVVYPTEAMDELKYLRHQYQRDEYRGKWDSGPASRQFRYNEAKRELVDHYGSLIKDHGSPWTQERIDHAVKHYGRTPEDIELQVKTWRAKWQQELEEKLARLKRFYPDCSE